LALGIVVVGGAAWFVMQGRSVMDEVVHGVAEVSQTPDKQAADLLSRIDARLKALKAQADADKKYARELQGRINTASAPGVSGPARIAWLVAEEKHAGSSAAYRESFEVYEGSLKKINPLLKAAEVAVSHNDSPQALKHYQDALPVLDELLGLIEASVIAQAADRDELVSRLNGAWALNSCDRNAGLWKVGGDVLHVMVGGKEVASERIVAAYEGKVFTYSRKSGDDLDYAQGFEYRIGKQTLEVRQGNKKQNLKACGAR